MTKESSPSFNKEVSDDLLKEKSLWEVYKLSWKLPFPYFIVITPFLFGITVFIFGVSTEVTNSEIIFSIRSVLDLGFTFTSTIFGFLIAGFTIFASLTQKKLFVGIAKIKMPDSDLNWLKGTFAVFMHAFAHFSAFLSLTIFIHLISQKNGIADWIFSNVITVNCNVQRYLLVAIFATLSAWLFYLTLLLSRFIFNIYHVCMLSTIVAGEEIIDDINDHK